MWLDYLRITLSYATDLAPWAALVWAMWYFGHPAFRRQPKHKPRKMRFPNGVPRIEEHR